MADPFKAQESTNQYFWVAIACLVVLNLGTFAFFYHMNSATKEELSQKTTQIQGAVTEANQLVKSTAQELDST